VGNQGSRQHAQAGPSRNRRRALIGLAAVVALAALGWIAARQIRSPAQIAADAAAPVASPITVPVERRTLSTNVIVRGTVRFGGRRNVELAASSLEQGSGSDIVTEPARLGRRLEPGDVALAVDGRPVFVLPGPVAMHRDLRRGSRGPDVRQLEAALARLGHAPGAVDGVFDAATQGAVSALYISKGFEPAGATDAQVEQIRTAEADAATARDAHLQALDAVEQARRGAAPGEVEQARIDAATALDALHTAELAVPAAEARLRTARTLARAAAGAEVVAEGNNRREQAAADAEVAIKQEAVDLAVEEERLALLRRNDVPLDAPFSERETAAAAVGAATRAVVRARAELAAAVAAARAIRAGAPAALRQARAEAANLKTDARLAAAERRRARRGVRVARQQVALQEARVRALARPQDRGTLVAIAAAAGEEARRTRAVVDRLSAESGVRVPGDEVVFLPDLPVRVDDVKARRGNTLSGPVMTVTSSRLVIDSSLSVADAKLVQPGDRVTIEEQELGVRAKGRVADMDTTPGTRGVDPNRFYFSVVPRSPVQALVGASVRLTIAVESTRGAVLAVPVSALSVGGDGSSRLQVRRDGRTRLVTVVPGLAAEGYAEVRPAAGERLEEGELVIVGADGGAGPPEGAP
jgi:peptidoglycan hydrolase-like protein with peptidoglycan-binding domain